MPYRAITSEADKHLTVYVDRSSPSATVYYTYGPSEDELDDQSTEFQTADLPADDERAWLMVERWVSGA